MGFGTKFIKALFIGFVFTPVFLVVISAFMFDIGIFTLYRGSPLSVHEIAGWLLLIEPRSRELYGLLCVIFAWSAAWLVVWSRTRDIKVIFIAAPLTYLLYILYLVSFWGYRIVLIIPDGLIQLLSTLAICSMFHVISIKKPKKTIFERLEAIGVSFPEYWKKDIDLPIICPKCSEPLYSSAKYCWKCHTDIEKFVEGGEL